MREFELHLNNHLNSVIIYTLVEANAQSMKTVVVYVGYNFAVWYFFILKNIFLYIFMRVINN